MVRCQLPRCVGCVTELFRTVLKMPGARSLNRLRFSPPYDYNRLKLIANNSRFLILPHWHRPNLGFKILSLCQRRLCADWQERFGHPLVLLETFVDYHRFQGTVNRAANWSYLCDTRHLCSGFTARPGLPVCAS